MRRVASDRATGGGTPHDRGPDRAIAHGANERAAGAVLRAAVDAYPAGGERTLRADSARPAARGVGPCGQRDRSAGGADLYVRVREAVSYTHLRAHETRHDLVCRLLLEKKKK